MQDSTQRHFPFPSIGQFKDIIKTVRKQSEYEQVPVPSLTFVGTVKLHGTNAAVISSPSGEIYYQSRERIITALNDNAGFAAWAYGQREEFKQLFASLEHLRKPGESIQIYGEWCGGNIQKGVGIANLPKMFVIFGLRVANEANTAWLDVTCNINLKVNPVNNCYLITDFSTWYVNIDFMHPEHIRNTLQELTLEVEKNCPVARALLETTDKDLIGEGIVWTCVDNPELKFKVKGEKHSASKVKVLAAVDTEKVESINMFVEKTCTTNRLNQGLDKLKELGLELSSKSTGEFIKWVIGDILKEELDMLVDSGLSTKEVTGQIASKARQFYLSSI